MCEHNKLASAFGVCEREDRIEARITSNTTLDRLFVRISTLGLAHAVRRVSADIGDHLYGGFFRNGFVIVFDAREITVSEVKEFLELL